MMDRQSGLQKVKSPNPFRQQCSAKVRYQTSSLKRLRALPKTFFCSFPQRVPFPHLDFEKDRNGELAFFRWPR